MIEDGDVAAAIRDQLAPLQRRRRLGDADAPHAEHVRKELVRQVELAEARRVARHEQPAREARRHPVEAVGRGGVRDLRHERVRIAMELPLKGGAGPDLLAKACRAHAQGRAAALHQRANRGHADAERQRNADHAFAADQADLERKPALHQRQQRNHAVGRKIHVANRLAWLVEHVAEHEGDRLQAGEQVAVGPGRQRGQHAVPGRLRLSAALGRHAARLGARRRPVCTLSHRAKIRGGTEWSAMRAGSMPFRRVLAVIAFFAAGSSAGEALGQSAAGAFTGEAGMRGAQGPLGRSQDQAADRERWSSYRDLWVDYHSSRIDATDAGKVSDIAGYLKQTPSFRLAIVGVMPAGDADLSDRRVDSVREALLAAGVPAYKIYTGTFGDPLLRRERRVEVLFSTRD